MTDTSKLQIAEARIRELEARIATLQTSHNELGEQTSHLIRVLGETRRELRATWRQQKRDAAEGNH